MQEDRTKKRLRDVRRIEQVRHVDSTHPSMKTRRRGKRWKVSCIYTITKKICSKSAFVLQTIGMNNMTQQRGRIEQASIQRHIQRCGVAHHEKCYISSSQACIRKAEQFKVAQANTSKYTTRRAVLFLTTSITAPPLEVDSTLYRRMRLSLQPLCAVTTGKKLEFRQLIKPRPLLEVITNIVNRDSSSYGRAEIRGRNKCTLPLLLPT